MSITLTRGPRVTSVLLINSQYKQITFKLWSHYHGYDMKLIRLIEFYFGYFCIFLYLFVDTFTWRRERTNCARKSREESFPRRAARPTSGALSEPDLPHERSPRARLPPASRSLPPATIRSLKQSCVRSATAQWLVQHVHHSRLEDNLYFTRRPLPHHWRGLIFLAAWCNCWLDHVSSRYACFTLTCFCESSNLLPTVSEIPTHSKCNQ